MSATRKSPVPRASCALQAQQTGGGRGCIVPPAAGAVHQARRPRHTALRAAWQQVCFAEPRQRRSLGAAILSSSRAQGGRGAAEGWGRPSRVRGDTSVTSQHSASPGGVAPYTTRPKRRRSAWSTLGADVRANHCCRTTWPSGPTASRAMRTHACSRGLARRQSERQAKAAAAAAARL